MKLFFIVFLAGSVSFLSVQVFAYNDTKTHPHITRRAITGSNLDQYLQNDLGLEKSLDPKRPGTFLVEKALFLNIFLCDLSFFSFPGSFGGEYEGYRV